MPSPCTPRSLHTFVRIELIYACQCSPSEKRSGLISHLLEVNQLALSDENSRFITMSQATICNDCPVKGGLIAIGGDLDNKEHLSLE
jgi:hypothetical protein